MDQIDLIALAHEVNDLKAKREYAECIRKMDLYLDGTDDPVVRTLALMGKATCAMQLGNLAAAQTAAFGIDPNVLDPEARNYARLVVGSVALQAGQFNKADSIYSEILADKAANEENSRDILCEATAGEAFAQARLHRYTAALSLLDLAFGLHPERELQDDIGIYRALCLQGQGRLDEAEQSVRNVLANSSGKSDADAWFRLGAILLQKRDFRGAIDSFQGALRKVSTVGVSRSSILTAIKETENEMKENSGTASGSATSYVQ